MLCVANQCSDVATSTIEGRLSKKIKNVEQTVDGLQSSVRTMGRDLKDVGPRRPSIGGPAAEELGDLTDATAEKAAIHGAVVTAKEKSIINAIKATGANKVHFNKQRTNLLQPFYRQPGYGGRAVDRTIKRFKALEAKGEAPEY